MTLTLHHADDLDPLLDVVGDLLTPPLADPFTADVVAVPTAGVRDAITAHLGSRLGVSGRGGDGVTANVELVYIGRFLSRALGQAADGDDLDPDPWHISRLTWSVLDILSRTSVDLPVPRDAVDWSFARRVADLFDRYATQRPQLIECWSRGIATDAAYGSDDTSSLLSDDHRWQFDLWREVRAHIGRPSLPEQLPDLLDRLRRGDLQPDLPPRVALVGFVSIAPSQWQVLQALGAVRDVHVMLRTPSRQAWHDARIDLGGRLVTARSRSGVPLDVTTGRRHPLVTSWGRRALDARAFLGGTPDVTVIDANRPLPAPTSLLQVVQSDIRLDRDPGSWSGDPTSRRSVQVHACHGETRQLEVLRDALGHLFLDHPDLRPHEVVVLCPQLDRFAPLVEAVFERGRMPIPVRVGDRSLTVDDPTADAFQAVLALVGGRAALTEMLALLQFAPIRRRFGWSDADVETITGWALELGVRWGLTPEQRLEWNLPVDIVNGTWQVFVQQLLAGIAQPAPTPRAGVGGIPPFDAAVGDSTVVAGSVAELIARLVALHDAVAAPRPIAEWVHLLHGALDEFCARDRDEPWALDAVHAALDDLLDAATPITEPDAAPNAMPLTLLDVQGMLSETIRERAGRLTLRSGAVTVTSMQPLHGVPARVVCVLGLDEGSLPGGSFDGDDILGVNPCVGERNPRHDARQMLLDSLLAARDAVIVTCNGNDITTNAPVPFVVPLSELLDVVAATIDVDVDANPIVVRHPRHAFDDSLFGAEPGRPMDGLDRPFSFDDAMLDAARERRSAPAVPDLEARVRRWRLTPHVDTVLGAGDLTSATTEPADQTLRQRLDVATLPEVGDIPDGLELGVDALRESSLGRDLLAIAAQRHPRPGSGGHPQRDPRWTTAVADWTSVALLDGSLPPGAIGLTVLDGVAEKVMGIWHAVSKHDLPFIGSDTVTVRHAMSIPFLDGTTTVVHLDGDVTGIDRSGPAPRLVDVRFAKYRPNRLLSVALGLALCQIAEPETEWSAFFLCRNSGKGAIGRTLRLMDDPQESAEQLVALATQLTWWSRCDAVPLFDDVSFELGRRSPTPKMLEDLDKAMRRDGREPLWRDWTADELLSVPVLPDDPVMLAPFTGQSRVIATARWVWDTYRHCVEETKADVKGPIKLKAP